MCTGSACRRGEGKRQAYRADGHAHGHAHGHAKATVATEAAEERHRVCGTVDVDVAQKIYSRWALPDARFRYCEQNGLSKVRMKKTEFSNLQGR